MKKKTESRGPKRTLPSRRNSGSPQGGIFQPRDLFKTMVPELDNKKLSPDTIISVKKKNVFDMTRVMARRPPEALKILSELLSDGTHPLQIMGGLVWFWGKQRQPLACEKFEKGLRILQAADLNIKRSRLRPDYAIELAVVKLCAILKPY